MLNICAFHRNKLKDQWIAATAATGAFDVSSCSWVFAATLSISLRVCLFKRNSRLFFGPNQNYLCHNQTPKNDGRIVHVHINNAIATMTKKFDGKHIAMSLESNDEECVWFWISFFCSVIWAVSFNLFQLVCGKCFVDQTNKTIK